MFGKKKVENYTLCPFIGHKPCIENECALYVEMTGKEPNEGEELIRKGACSIAWTATISLEGNKAIREHGAATESLRNRIDESNKINAETVVGLRSFLATVGDFVKLKSLKG